MPAYAIYALIVVISVALSFLITPKIQQETPNAQAFDAPTAEEGRPITVLFGTRDIDSPNVTWFAPTNIVPIKK